MKQLYYFAFRAMGCMVEAQLQTAEDGAALLASLPMQFEAIEAQLSRFRPNSDLMQLNACAGQWTQVSAALFETVALAKHAARMTDGLFNPLILPALIASGYDRSFDMLGVAQSGAAGTVGDWRTIRLRHADREVFVPEGTALDLGGIAKGWAAAQIADQLAEYGACLISVGGDIVVRGAPEGEPGWRITIDDPDGNSPLCELRLRDTAVVTSGIDYRRWQTVDGQLRHHIIDPRSGYSAATDVCSVSVVHRDATTAEAYSKAVIMLGSRSGLDWLNQQWGAAGLVVSTNGTVIATTNWLTTMERTYT